MEKGYIYVATGLKYVKEGEQSAQTLKNVSPTSHITLITNEPYESTVFDDVIVISYTNKDKEDRKEGYLFKVIGFMSSPYEKTIFLDTDTFLCEGLDDAFDMLDFFDVLVCHDYYDKALVKHNGSFVPGYFPYNTGFVAFRKSPEVQGFLNLWEEVYSKEFDDFWGDQHAFMKALMLGKVRIHVLSSIYNFRFLNNVAILENEKVKMVHGRCSLKEFESIKNEVNKDISQRVWVANRMKCYSWEEKNFVIKYTKKIYAFVRKTFGLG